MTCVCLRLRPSINAVMAWVLLWVSSRVGPSLCCCSCCCSCLYGTCCAYWQAVRPEVMCVQQPQTQPNPHRKFLGSWGSKCHMSGFTTELGSTRGRLVITGWQDAHCHSHHSCCITQPRVKQSPRRKTAVSSLSSTCSSAHIHCSIILRQPAQHVG